MGFKLLSFIFIPSSNEDNARINENDTLNSKGDYYDRKNEPGI